MLQALATLLFSILALVAVATIGMLLADNWSAIRRALGMVAPPTPAPLPPRYRTLPARRAMIMTVREAPARAAA